MLPGNKEVLLCMNGSKSPWTAYEADVLFANTHRPEHSDSGFGMLKTQLLRIRQYEQKKIEKNNLALRDLDDSSHYHTPWYPTIKGMESFLGETLHSHDYRDSAHFQGKKVAVVGAGPSGIDMALEIAKNASRVILSRHRGGDIRNVLPQNSEMKFEIVEINENRVFFDDGTSEDVDTILYCTGYKYSFPFLSKECGISVVDNCVQPLYKHLIHIEYQTMALIGLPYYVCACALFDLQVRVFLKFLNGEIQLPSKKEMHLDTENEMNKRKSKGLKTRQFHMMGTMQGDYYSELAEAGGLESLPPVMAQLHTHASQTQMDDLISFRDKVYKIVSSSEFIQVE